MTTAAAVELFKDVHRRHVRAQAELFDAFTTMLRQHAAMVDSVRIAERLMAPYAGGAALSGWTTQQCHMKAPELRPLVSVPLSPLGVLSLFHVIDHKQGPSCFLSHLQLAQYGADLSEILRHMSEANAELSAVIQRCGGCDNRQSGDDEESRAMGSMSQNTDASESLLRAVRMFHAHRVDVTLCLRRALLALGEGAVLKILDGAEPCGRAEGSSSCAAMPPWAVDPRKDWEEVCRRLVSDAGRIFAS
jgi:hypothetical protein